MPEHTHILVTDDHPQVVDYLEQLLGEEGYAVDRAYDGTTALRLARERRPDLLILDVMMPGLSGLEVCQELKADEDTRLIPIVMLTALGELEHRIKGIEAGADTYLAKPVNRLELLTSVRSLLKTKRLNDRLEDIEQVITTMALALEAKDPYTHGHSERVAIYATHLIRAAGGTPAELKAIRQGGLLHDIGKIGIPESVLQKPGPLTESERVLMRTHPVVSARICAPLRSAGVLLPLIRHHHERYDGKGYPDGLAGSDIPRLARALAIADGYDAMTSARSYRGSLGHERAIDILRNGAGTEWCPELVPIFVALDLLSLTTQLVGAQPAPALA
ncbi:MAG: response regulator [Chloroflexi bacterium]|nr:response regulator [Chloroflexota bacterium]